MIDGHALLRVIADKSPNLDNMPHYAVVPVAKYDLDDKPDGVIGTLLALHYPDGNITIRIWDGRENKQHALPLNKDWEDAT